MKRRLPLPAIIGIVIGAAVTLYFFVGVTYHVIEKKLNPPPAPAVQHAEFPYRIVYEKDEEIFTVEDTLVIEFVDSGWSFELGDVYEWDRYLLSERPSVRHFSSGRVYLDQTQGIYYLCATEWLMGLEEVDSFMPPGFYADKAVDDPFTDEVLFSKYGIKIIEKQLPTPIKNSFEDK